MNKKLLAVAVAGALAAPGVALAQSAVTISGFFKVGFENLSYSNPVGTRVNNSQNRVQDNSSQIIFSMREDLGNGLAAIAQLDQRFMPTNNNVTSSATSNALANGNTYVGLSSSTWGDLTMGRWDLHYAKGGHDIAAKAGALEASGISLFDFIGGGAIANATRTPNVVKWQAPNWSGFTGIVAWSANPSSGTGGAGDMTNLASNATAQTIAGGPTTGTVVLGAAGAGTAFPTVATAAAGTTTSRKGEAWNINPKYSNGPFFIEYSYWSAKPDAPGTATTDQRGDVLAGSYTFGGFKVGLGYNKSRLNNSNSGIRTAERTAWTLPLSYTWGPNNIVGHYTKAGQISCDTGGGCAGSNTGAKMLAIAYVYDLSKRTSLGLTYARIDNDANATYNFFTSASLGTNDTTTAAGEKPRLLQATIKHAF